MIVPRGGLAARGTTEVLEENWLPGKDSNLD